MFYLRPLLTALAAITPAVDAAGATLRFSCSQLAVDRIDPIAAPGILGSPHLHQFVGGNALNATLGVSLPDQSTCTSCVPTEDFSNYWTAVLYFKARNGTYKRVSTLPNPLGYSAANGGQTVYYLSTGKVTAFKPGFRMTVGDPAYRTAAQQAAEPVKAPQLQFTCLATSSTRTGYISTFPTTACKVGIMVSVRFPTCWDGVNLDSPDHQNHVADPVGSGCPTSHPVAIPQVFYETYWDTTPFNDKSLWPADGSQPFVWSFGDTTGYGNHADYVFGWRGDALQRAMDAGCSSDLFADDLKCTTLKRQTIAQANKCTKSNSVPDKLEGWVTELPGGVAMSR